MTSRPIPLVTPLDVLAAIPYLLGYRPLDTVAVLGLRGEDLIFAGSGDLPAAAADAAVDRLTRRLLSSTLRARVGGVIVAAFGSAERSLPILDGLLDRYASAGIAVHEALRVDRGWFWSYACGDPTCCPPAGWPYDPDDTHVPAAATFAGRVILADREAFEAQLSPVGGPPAIAIERASRRAADRLAVMLGEPTDLDSARRSLRAAGRAALDLAVRRQRDDGRIDDDLVAWLSVLMISDDVLEIGLRQILRRDDLTCLHRALWLEVVRRATPGLVAGPACLFATAAHLHGEPALARLALERVLRADPEHVMADTLYDTIVLDLPLSTEDDPVVPGAPVNQPGVRRPRRRSSSRRAGSRPT
jgi:hypothetical protein